MAIFAKNIDMRTIQWEITEVVVKKGIIPTDWIVAGCAVRSKAPTMLIVLAMAGIAVRGRSLENVILVALFTA